MRCCWKTRTSRATGGKEILTLNHEYKDSIRTYWMVAMDAVKFTSQHSTKRTRRPFSQQGYGACSEHHINTFGYRYQTCSSPGFAVTNLLNLNGFRIILWIHTLCNQPTWMRSLKLGHEIYSNFHKHLQVSSTQHNIPFLLLELLRWHDTAQRHPINTHTHAQNMPEFRRSLLCVIIVVIQKFVHNGCHTHFM